jgi:GxxExxY protein
MKHAELSQQIIDCFFRVYNQLGYGFLETVYKKAMLIEEKKLGLQVESEMPISVLYEGQLVGEFFADQVVEGKIIVEFKAVHSLLPEHSAQILNYLNATDLEVGLLFNFGPKPEFHRKSYDNERKKYIPPVLPVKREKP